jgi:Glycosyl hydrolase family 12
MHKLALFIFIVVSLTAFSACQKSAIAPSTGTPTVEANWSTDDRYGTFTTDGYTLSNNVWTTSKPGPQTIWVNSASNWGVWSDQVGGGVKSYPNVGKNIGKTIESLKTLTSSFNITMPKTGCYEAAYDIWGSKNYEIMLWVYTNGGAGPVAGGHPPAAAGLVAGGHTWNAYRGSLFGHPVVSFVRTSNTSAGTVNIKAILRWMKKEGWIDNSTIGTLQFGTEISSTAPGGSNFNFNSYSLTVE